MTSGAPCHAFTAAHWPSDWAAHAALTLRHTNGVSDTGVQHCCCNNGNNLLPTFNNLLAEAMASLTNAIRGVKIDTEERWGA